MAFRALIAGHSQVKYFEKYLELTNVDVVSFSGFRVEQMWGVIGPNVTKYNIVCLHIGANNLWNDDPPLILSKYQELVYNIIRVNPRYNIVT